MCFGECEKTFLNIKNCVFGMLKQRFQMRFLNFKHKF